MWLEYAEIFLIRMMIVILQSQIRNSYVLRFWCTLVPDALFSCLCTYLFLYIMWCYFDILHVIMPFLLLLTRIWSLLFIHILILKTRELFCKIIHLTYVSAYLSSSVLGSILPLALHFINRFSMVHCHCHLLIKLVIISYDIFQL